MITSDTRSKNKCTFAGETVPGVQKIWYKEKAGAFPSQLRHSDIWFHPAPYSVGTRGLSPKGKAPGACSWSSAANNSLEVTSTFPKRLNDELFSYVENVYAPLNSKARQTILNFVICRFNLIFIVLGWGRCAVTFAVACSSLVKWTCSRTSQSGNGYEAATVFRSMHSPC
jgi:hypothetical protein